MYFHFSLKITTERRAEQKNHNISNTTKLSFVLHSSFRAICDSASVFFLLLFFSYLSSACIVYWKWYPISFSKTIFFFPKKGYCISMMYFHLRLISVSLVQNPHQTFAYYNFVTVTITIVPFEWIVAPIQVHIYLKKEKKSERKLKENTQRICRSGFITSILKALNDSSANVIFCTSFVVVMVIDAINN